LSTVTIDGVSAIQFIVDSLNTACCPEDVFGNDPSKSYKQLAKMCHPDIIKHPLAEQTFQKLNTMKEEADKRVADKTWGKRLPLPHCIPLDIGAFRVKRSPYIGDVADLYRVEGKPLIVKVVRSADDNDLLRAEQVALSEMSKITTVVKEGVPKIVDSFQIAGRWKRQVNVITQFPGFWTAAEIHSVTKIDDRTMVWMFKRLLALLTWAHHFRIVHGAILPPHVMFYPDNDGGGVDARKHSTRLIDWCYSVNFEKRTRLSAWVPAWKDMYAPELLDKSYIGPESDIYMAAQLMLYLRQSSLFMPELQTVILKCLEKDPKKRYRKAGDVLEDWKKAAVKAYGAPKWWDFNLPTTPSGR
jgi:serine/threonine protein kinase